MDLGSDIGQSFSLIYGNELGVPSVKPTVFCIHWLAPDTKAAMSFACPLIWTQANEDFSDFAVNATHDTNLVAFLLVIILIDTDKVCP